MSNASYTRTMRRYDYDSHLYQDPQVKFQTAICYRCETKDNYRLCAGNTVSYTTNYLNRCFVSYT